MGVTRGGCALRPRVGPGSPASTCCPAARGRRARGRLELGLPATWSWARVPGPAPCAVSPGNVASPLEAPLLYNLVNLPPTAAGRTKLAFVPSSHIYQTLPAREAQEMRCTGNRHGPCPPGADNPRREDRHETTAQTTIYSCDRGQGGA